MNETLDRLLSAYLDGSLSPARRAAVEKRLAEPRVARRLAQLRSLGAGLKGSAPRPSAAQSRRMWMAIKAQVAAQNPRAAEPWYAFLQRRWFSPAWGYGLSAAAAAVAVVLLWPTALPQQASAVQDEAAPALAAPAAPEAEDQAASAAPAPADPAPASVPVRRPAPAEARREMASAPAAKMELSEVERALAEDPVDGLIERFLREQPAASAPASAPAPAMASRRSLSRAPSAGATTVAAFGADASLDEAGFDSAVLQQVQGGPDRNGFWNWQPTGAALNQRDWQQARVELEAAQRNAREASERAFAASALTLLSAAGQPLQGSQPALPQTGDLRVLSAGVWQLQMDSRLARFSRGFSARLPGFRVEGDSLLLDMTFDRGSFSPGARFTRVSGEAPARVFDAAAQAVDADDFTAPSGAVYNVQERELRLR